MNLSYREFLEHLKLLESGTTSFLYEIYLDCLKEQQTKEK